MYDSSGKFYVKQTKKTDIDDLPFETFNDDHNDDEEEGKENSNPHKYKKRTKARIIRSVFFNKEVNVEKHYRKLIMLFTLWRNEETDASYDLLDDVEIPSTASNREEQLILNEMQDQEYRQIVQKLNKEQKEFFYYILHQIKTSDEPFYNFLCGGAGVRKSHLIKALYRATVKYFKL